MSFPEVQPLDDLWMTSAAKAIRTLARIVGMRNNARVNVRIEEPEGGRMSSGLLGSKEGASRDVEDILGDLQ